MATAPQVMISSTFFDLKQVRADLGRFLSDDLGCRLLVSEWPSFPIDPDVDTVENCRRRVERDADVLILVIGGRYGSVDSKSSRSVTNIEYLAARAKGIPIYAFVEKQVLYNLSAWKNNRELSFQGVVDDNRVFSFIEKVMEIDKVWMRGFELADEIVTSLRAQFAYLICQGVQWLQRSKGGREYQILQQLQGVPLRIALEKPLAWEHKLFGELLVQEIQARRSLSEQRRLGLVYGSYQWIDLYSVKPWTNSRMAELQCLINGFNVLVNEELKKAVGAPGEPGDMELLVFTARSLAALYEETIEWSLRVRRTVGEGSMNNLVQLISAFVEDMIEKIGGFGSAILREVDRLLAAVARGEPAKSSIILDLEITGAEDARKAFDLLAQQLGEEMSSQS